MLRRLQHIRPAISDHEARDLARYLVAHRDRRPLPRRLRAHLILSIWTLGTLCATIGLGFLVGNYDHQLGTEARTAVISIAALIFGLFLMTSVVVPFVLHFAKPQGYEEMQAAFRWAADRPGQGSRGLPIGPLTHVSANLETLKQLVRYRLGGPMMTLIGVMLTAVGTMPESRWALLGSLLIPAGIALHRWSTGRYDAPQAARYLLENYVCGFARDEFGVHADAATQAPQVAWNDPPAPARVVYPGTQGLPREELEYRIYYARHNPDVAGTLRGRPRHFRRARIH